MISVKNLSNLLTFFLKAKSYNFKVIEKRLDPGTP